MSHHNWTSEEVNKVKEMLQTMSRAEVAEKMNVTIHQIAWIINGYQLHRYELVKRKPQSAKIFAGGIINLNVPRGFNFFT
jgi:transcriptional regulator with XRE-family HTH domain